MLNPSCRRCTIRMNRSAIRASLAIHVSFRRFLHNVVSALLKNRSKSFTRCGIRMLPDLNGTRRDQAGAGAAGDGAGHGPVGGGQLADGVASVGILGLVTTFPAPDSPSPGTTA